MHPLFGSLYLFFYLIYCYIDSFIRLFIPRSKKSVEGKIVLVTGAGHGIGRELALQFSQLGAKLILWDINKSQNESVASEIEERGRFVRAYTVDVTNTDNIKAAARQVRRDVGHVEILINNAGVLNGGALLNLRDDDIRRLMEINIVSHFWTIKEFLPAMVDRNEGHIVAVASICGHVGLAYLTDYTKCNVGGKMDFRHLSLYCHVLTTIVWDLVGQGINEASKFAVVGFMGALIDELRREGHSKIELTTVCPSFVDTGMTKDARSKYATFMPPDWVAGQIIDGVLKNKRDIYLPAGQELYFRSKKLLPQKFADYLSEKLEFGINPQYQ